MSVRHMKIFSMHSPLKSCPGLPHRTSFHSGSF